jgi:hypothetical protein
MSTIDPRRCEVLLSVQRALLSEITPNIRAVTVEYDATSIHIEMFFDGEISDDDRETVLLVDTEVLAEFPAHHRVDTVGIRRDAPAPIPKDRLWAYYRKEG